MTTTRYIDIDAVIDALSREDRHRAQIAAVEGVVVNADALAVVHDVLAANRPPHYTPGEWLLVLQALSTVNAALKDAT